MRFLVLEAAGFVGIEVGSFASVDSLMDLQSLGELFRKLHEEAEVGEVGRKGAEKDRKFTSSPLLIRKVLVAQSFFGYLSLSVSEFQGKSSLAQSHKRCKFP